MILVNVMWTEKNVNKESLGLEPRVAGRLLWELERRGIKGKFIPVVLQ